MGHECGNIEGLSSVKYPLPQQKAWPLWSPQVAQIICACVSNPTNELSERGWDIQSWEHSE